MLERKGFTLIELLVVISIISLLSSIVLASLNTARSKARDAKRVAEIKQLQNALALYYDSNNGTYPVGTWANDCGGDANNLQPALAPLVTQGFIPTIPHDPNFPNNPWPQCIYYHVNYNCGTGDAVHQYILIFKTETTQMSLPSWGNEPNRWCLYP